MTDPNHPMNALMRLNQIHPGLQYRLLSQSGPVHAPVFTMSVDIQGTTYQATGNSKRTAKLQVALKVFRSSHCCLKKKIVLLKLNDLRTGGAARSICITIITSQFPCETEPQFHELQKSQASLSTYCQPH